MKKGYAHISYATKEVQTIVDRATLYGVTLLQNAQLVEGFFKEDTKEHPCAPEALNALVALVAWVDRAHEEAELS